MERWGFAGALLVLAAGGLWFYESERGRQRRAAERDIELIAQLKVDQIVWWRRDRLADAMVLAEGGQLAEALAQYLSGHGSAALDRELRGARPLVQYRGYAEAMVVDAAGRVATSLSGTAHSLHKEALETLDRAIRGGKPVLSDLHAGDGDSVPHIEVIGPLFAAQGDRRVAIGALVLRTEARQYLFPLIQSWPTSSATAETLLVRREGESVLFLNELRHQRGTALALRIPLAREDVPAVMAARGRMGFFRGRDYRGVEVFSYVRAVPGSPWFIVAKVDAAEALASWRTRSLLIVGLILGFGAWLGTAFIALSQRSRAAHYVELAAARDRAQAELRQSEERFRRIFEEGPIGMVLVSADFHFAAANGAFCRMLGYSEAEIKPLTFRDVTHPEHVAQDVEAVRKVVDGTVQVYRTEKRYVRKDGGIVWGAVTVTAVRDEHGRFLYILAMIEEITERKRAEREIQQLNEELEERVRERTARLEVANKELEAFAYSVSHDLRAPLRGIDGWSLALLEDCRGELSAQAREYLDRVRSEAQRMGRLIDDMLSLSRVSQADLTKRRVDLSALAQTVLLRLKSSEPERAVDLRVQAGLSAHGDAALLEVVLSNLLGNAWKFSAPRQSARIEFGRVELPAGPALFVRDNGVGFDMGYAHKLFGAFQRMHKASEFPGTGVGLATVQRIIHRHGGRVWAEAEVDRGATIYFTLEGGA